MKTKFLISFIILILPLAISPSSVIAVENQPVDNVFSSTLEENSKIPISKPDMSYITEWRDIVSNFKSPTFDYSISHPEVIINTVNYLKGNADTSQPGLVDAQKCYECDIETETIYIDSEDDLSNYNGSGSVDDPYLISGLDLSSGRANLIEIVNITVHVMISENILNGEYSQFANIVIHNSANITIQNNNMTRNNGGIIVSNSDTISILGNRINQHVIDSITVTSSSNFVIQSNNIWDNGNGIVIDNSSSGYISTNNVHNNFGYGTIMRYSTGFTIDKNNIFQNAGDGIFFKDSDGNEIIENTIYSNGYGTEVESDNIGLFSFNQGHITLDASFGGAGIWLDPSFENIVSDNIVFDNAGIGVFLEYSGSTTINNNNVRSNGLSGIFLLDSNNNAITNNAVTGNGVSEVLSDVLTNAVTPMDYFLAASFGGAGIWLDPSINNTISGNNLSSNTGQGVIIQESDFTSLENNSISSNGLNGIFFMDTDDSTISNNVIVSNGESAEEEIFNNVNLSPLEAKLMASFGGAGIWLDPSHRNVVDGNIVSDNAGSGVFLLESTTTTISNNQILSNSQDGVFFIDSPSNAIVSNLVDSNGFGASERFLNALTPQNYKLFASFGGAGIWLDPSPNNIIEDNIVSNSASSGIYFLDTNNSMIIENTIESSGSIGIFFQDSSHNSILSNRVNYNGGTLSQAAGNLDASFGGAGIWLDPSHFNTLTENNVTNNEGDAIFSEGSTNSFVADNRFLNNTGYGVNLDDQSTTSTIRDNNFIGNSQKLSNSKQGRDDGNLNDVISNFWDDNDNTDRNYDGIADNSYELNGDSNNVDQVPSNIPEGLNFYTAEGKLTSQEINLKSKGKELKFRVTLDDGFRALSIDLTKILLDGTVQPIRAQIDSILSFTVVFSRQEVHDYIRSLDLDLPILKTFELNLLMNDELLDVTSYDDVIVKDGGKKGKLWFVAGISGMMAIPAIGSKKQSKISSLLNKIKNKIN